MNSSSKLSKPVVLFAEEDPGFFLITKHALELVGFRGRLERVANYRQIFNYLLEEQESPALIIMDVEGKPKDWLDTLRELKKDGCYGKIPIAVLTGSNDPEESEHCKSFPGCSCVQKPWTFNDWSACLSGLLYEHVFGPSKLAPNSFHSEAESGGL